MLALLPLVFVVEFQPFHQSMQTAEGADAAAPLLPAFPSFLLLLLRVPTPTYTTTRLCICDFAHVLPGSACHTCGVPMACCLRHLLCAKQCARMRDGVSFTALPYMYVELPTKLHIAIEESKCNVRLRVLGTSHAQHARVLHTHRCRCAFVRMCTYRPIFPTPHRFTAILQGAQLICHRPAQHVCVAVVCYCYCGGRASGKAMLPSLHALHCQLLDAQATRASAKRPCKCPKQLREQIC